MRLGSKTVAVIAVTCAVGLGGSATAADTGATTSPPNRAPTTSPVQDPKSAADGAIAGLSIQRKTVNGMLQKARQERDVIKVLCLNDKLSQLDVTIRSAAGRKANLDSAFQRGQTEIVNHEATIIGVYKERGDRLTAEANQCIGSDVGFIGASQVTVDIDPSIADDNTAAGGTGNPGNACPDCGWVQPVSPVSPTQ